MFVPPPVPLVPVPLVPVPLVPVPLVLVPVPVPVPLVPLVPVPDPDPPERPPPVGSVGAGVGDFVVVVGGGELVVVVCVGVEPVVLVLRPVPVEPLDVEGPVVPWLVAGPPPRVEMPPPTGFAKCPPPLVVVLWLVVGVPEPVVVGADGLEVGVEPAGVLGVEVLGFVAGGAGWLPVPNVPVPRYGALPLVVGCPGWLVVGCAGVTPTGATGTSGLMIGFVPIRPVGESGCRTSTSVAVEVRLCWRLAAAELDELSDLDTATPGAAVATTAAGRLSAWAAAGAATGAARVGALVDAAAW